MAAAAPGKSLAGRRQLGGVLGLLGSCNPVLCLLGVSTWAWHPVDLGATETALIVTTRPSPVRCRRRGWAFLGWSLFIELRTPMMMMFPSCCIAGRFMHV